MSNAGDEKLVDEYLRGASPYSELYRAVEADDVPGELDRDVLAEARAAVSRRKRMAWQRFTPMLAVAATAVLTISVVMRTDWLTPAQQFKTTSESSSIPKIVNVEAKPPAEAPVLSDLKAERTAEVMLDTPRPSLERRQGSPIELAGSAAPAAPPAPAAATEADKRFKKQHPKLDQAQVVDEVRRSNAQALPPTVLAKEKQRLESHDRVGPRESVPSSVAAKEYKAVDVEESTVTARKADDNRFAAGLQGAVRSAPLVRTDSREAQLVRETTPTTWLDYIRELRNAGKGPEANREWERFVKAFPNFTVEPDDAARPKKAEP